MCWLIKIKREPNNVRSFREISIVIFVLLVWKSALKMGSQGNLWEPSYLLRCRKLRCSWPQDEDTETTSKLFGKAAGSLSFLTWQRSGGEEEEVFRCQEEAPWPRHQILAGLSCNSLRHMEERENELWKPMELFTENPQKIWLSVTSAGC